MLNDTMLYGATFFLGLLLGVLCDAQTLLDPKVGLLLILGIVALAISAIGGLFGGWVVYWFTKKYNPVIGIAGVSCVQAKLLRFSNMAQGYEVLEKWFAASLCLPSFCLSRRWNVNHAPTLGLGPKGKIQLDCPGSLCISQRRHAGRLHRNLFESR